MSAKAMDSAIVRWPTERAKAWLASFLERARRDENVVAIVAIGSAVRSAAAETWTSWCCAATGRP